MTPQKTILFTLVGCFVILSVLRETGIISLGFYKSEFNSTSHAMWNGGSTKVTFGDTKPQPKIKNTDISIVVLMGKDTLYKEINKLSSIVITINSLQTGSLWIPLYKSVNFSAVGTAELDNVSMKRANSSQSVSKLNLSGRLTITGVVSITGMCSYRDAKKLIENIVVENFKAKSKDYFLSVEPEFLQNLASIKNAGR